MSYAVFPCAKGILTAKLMENGLSDILFIFHG